MADVVRNLTVGAALALGADPRDPNLSHIHETVHGEDCCQYQYQLLSNYKIELVKVLNQPTNFVSLCPSRTETRGKPQRSACE